MSASPAVAVVSVARAEIGGSRLRLEGTAIASRSITVDGALMGSSDSSGDFRIERDPNVAPADCTVDVNDGSTAATPFRLSGCTVTSPLGDTTAPSAPSSLSASLAGSTATPKWVASTDAAGVTGYRVIRNGTVLPGTVSGTALVNSGLVGGNHTYTVTAVDGAGNVSAASKSAPVTVGSTAPLDTTGPTAPLDLTPTVVGITISLGWSLSTDNTAVADYRVTRNGVVRAPTTDTSRPARPYQVLVRRGGKDVPAGVTSAQYHGDVTGSATGEPDDRFGA